MENMELIIKVNDMPQINPSLEKMLDDFTIIKQRFEETEKEFRNKLLSAMQENGIYSASVGKYKITCVSAKNKEIFNQDEFILHEKDDVIALFTSFETKENFSLETLKEKYPEIYKECCNEETIATVDTKKLLKNFPDLYTKYTTIIPGEGTSYIKITGGKK